MKAFKLLKVAMKFLCSGKLHETVFFTLNFSYKNEKKKNYLAGNFMS